MNELFPNNIHKIERVVRVIIGAVLLSLVFVGPQSLWGLLGLIPLATGIIGTCPPYTLLGISTCRRKEDPGAPQPEGS